MKQYTIVLEGGNFSPERLNMASKFLVEVLKIDGIQAGNTFMSINFPEEQEAKILALAQKFGVVDFTKND